MMRNNKAVYKNDNNLCIYSNYLINCLWGSLLLGEFTILLSRGVYNWPLF